MTQTPSTTPQAKPQSSADDVARICQHVGLIRQQCLRRGVSYADVDDVIQRTLLKLLSLRHRIHPGSERAFISRVASFEAGHVRRSYARCAEIGVSSLEDYETDLPSPESALHLRRAIGRARQVVKALDDSLGRTLYQHEALGLTCREIALREALPIGTVKSRLRRARLAVKANLVGVDSTHTENAGTGRRPAESGDRR
jgi:RNA polymerase sigma-70 factor, ECF subfamily